MDILRERKENAKFVPFSEGTKITIERLDQYRNQYPEPFIMAQIILPFSGIAKKLGKCLRYIMRLRNIHLFQVNFSGKKMLTY